MQAYLVLITIEDIEPALNKTSAETSEVILTLGVALKQSVLHVALYNGHYFYGVFINRLMPILLLLQSARQASIHSICARTNNSRL